MLLSEGSQVQQAAADEGRYRSAAISPPSLYAKFRFTSRKVA